MFYEISSRKKKSTVVGKHPDPTEEFPGPVADTHGCDVDLLGGDS
jgi:hypothetical protein